MNKFILSVVSVLMAFSLFAEPPEAPVKLFGGCINGYVNFTFAVGGDAACRHFQAKAPDADDSAWQDMEFKELYGPGYERYFSGYKTPVTTNKPLQYRVCETNVAGESSAWVDLGVVEHSIYLKGTTFGDKGNAGTSFIADGEVIYPYETSSQSHHAGHKNMVVGVGFTSPVTVLKIRYVPRQDGTGQNRLAGDTIQCADDQDFTVNVRTLGAVPTNKADVVLNRVLELALDVPVTARYFRFRHEHRYDDYMSLSEMEICPSDLPKPIDLAVLPVSYEDMRATVTWSIPYEDQCTSGCVQRATSPLGPYVDITEWSESTIGGSFVDSTAAAGVRYFYRVKADCPFLGGIQFSEPKSYVRSHRLDRDPSAPTELLSGVTIIPCFSYVKDETGYYSSGAPLQIKQAFDGDVATIPETSTYVSNGTCRVKNVLVGVDMGTPHYITGVIAYPRPSPQIQRLKPMALFGANAEHMVDADQLSETYATIDPQYDRYNYMSASEEYADRTYRYVYLLAPGPYELETFANVAEAGFFGYSWQDTVDSGVLVPPASVAVDGVAQNVTVSWTESANAVSNVVERRVAGGEWMTVASLPPAVLAFTDFAAPEGESLEYRVTAWGADGAYAYSYVVASIVPEPGTAQLPPVEIVRSEDLSTLAAVVSWSGCCGTYVHGGTLQRSVSPNGPFADLKELDHPVASFTMTDLTAMPGVTYYYRVRFICDDPLLSGEVEVASEPVPFIRARRLERDESDLTTLREGVTAIPPFHYLGYEGEGELSGAEGGAGDHRVRRVFDNDTTSFCELKYVLPGRTEAEWGYQYRALNGAIGVDLGSDCHVVGVNAHPRSDASADRLGPHAIWGGRDSSDTNTWMQLSQTYKEKYGSISSTDFHWYYMPSDDDETTYRYVFLWGVGPRGIFEGTYCNVAEMAIFGWSENDAADSGLVFAPTEISVAPNTSVMVISWNAGVNVDSYLVQRRTSAAEAWTDVATLPSTALSYADGEKLKKGHYEFRVIAKGADDTEAWTAVTGCDFRPKRGILLIVR